MAPIVSFLMRIPDEWKALTALGGAIAIGAAGTMVLVGFMDLPAQVESHEERLETVEDWRETHTREFRALVCLLTLPEDLPNRERLERCGI